MAVMLQSCVGLGVEFGPYIIRLGYLAKNRQDEPPEDAYPQVLVYQENLVFGIADGVTRSRSKEGIYPNPSPGRIAADFALEASIFSINNSLREGKKPSQDMLLKALKAGNERVRRVNRELGITETTVDYSTNDYAATTLTLGILTKGQFENYVLFWGHIADGSLLVISPDGIKRLTSIQTYQKDRLDKELREKHRDRYDNEEWRKHYRSKLRNNIRARAKIAGICTMVGFGVLTGEKEAEDFMETGQEEITPEKVSFLSRMERQLLMKGWGKLRERQDRKKKSCQEYLRRRLGRWRWRVTLLMI